MGLRGRPPAPAPRPLDRAVLAGALHPHRCRPALAQEDFEHVRVPLPNDMVAAAVAEPVQARRRKGGRIGTTLLAHL